MAPINPFKLMGKTTVGSPSEAEKSKGKGKSKGVGQGKKGRNPIFQAIAPEQSTPSADSGSAAYEPQQQLPVIHEIEVSNHGEHLVPKRKKGHPEVIMESVPRASSHIRAWSPELLYGTSPISI